MSRGLANNNQQQARLRQRQRLRQKQYDADLLAVLQRPEGRRFIWRLFDDTCQVLAVNHSPDSYHQGVHNGARGIGLFFWKEAQRVAPEEFLAMFHEAQKQKADDDVLRTDAEKAAQEADESGEE